MFQRVFYLSSPLSVGLAAYAVAVSNRKNVGELQTTPAAQSESSINWPVTVDSSGAGQVQRWDSNWDQRDPFAMIDRAAYEAANEEKRAEMLTKVTPTTTRNIFLIRHGQYELDTKKNELTALGREQADILGKRLAQLEAGKGKKITHCYVSTKQRAKETAEIALKHLPHVAEIQRHSDLLREGAPYLPEPPFKTWRPPYYFYEDGARIEAAFRKYIHRASPKQKEDSYELFFCHANVIRYFVCRALQFPPEGWLRMSLMNSSITWIRIHPSGSLSLLALGDFGHLPPEKTSFT